MVANSCEYIWPDINCMECSNHVDKIQTSLMLARLSHSSLLGLP